LGHGLQQLLDWSDGDVADVFLRTFEISYEIYGKVKTYPLVEDGADIMVTNENRRGNDCNSKLIAVLIDFKFGFNSRFLIEYVIYPYPFHAKLKFFYPYLEFVELYIEHFVNIFSRRQFLAFRRGFYKVCGGRALKMCRSEELELLLCGSRELDFTELEKSAEYDDGYGPDHEVIKWFWDIVHNMSLEQKKMMLNFVTASDRVPLRGLGDLTFVIQRNGPDSERYILLIFTRMHLYHFFFFTFDIFP